MKSLLKWIWCLCFGIGIISAAFSVRADDLYLHGSTFEDVELGAFPITWNRTLPTGDNCEVAENPLKDSVNTSDRALKFTIAPKANGGTLISARVSAAPAYENGSGKKVVIEYKVLMPETTDRNYLYFNHAGRYQVNSNTFITRLESDGYTNRPNKPMRIVNHGSLANALGGGVWHTVRQYVNFEDKKYNVSVDGVFVESRPVDFFNMTDAVSDLAGLLVFNVYAATGYPLDVTSLYLDDVSVRVVSGVDAQMIGSIVDFDPKNLLELAFSRPVYDSDAVSNAITLLNETSGEKIPREFIEVLLSEDRKKAQIELLGGLEYGTAYKLTVAASDDADSGTLALRDEFYFAPDSGLEFNFNTKLAKGSYIIGNVTVTPSDAALATANTVQVTAKKVGSDDGVLLIVGVYNQNNEMLVASNGDFAGGDEVTLALTLPDTANEIHSVRTFLWDEGKIPLHEEITVTATDAGIQTGSVNISGELEGYGYNRYVSVVAFNADSESDKAIYIGQAKANFNGEYGHRFSVGEDSGNFLIYIMGNEANEIIEYSFLSTNDYISFVGDIRGGILSDSAIVAFIKKYSKSLDADISKFLSSRDDKILTRIIKENAGTLTDGDFSKMKTFVEKAAAECTLLYAVKNATPWSAVYTELEKGTTITGIDFGEYEKVTNKRNVLSKFMGVEFESAAALKLKFDQLVHDELTAQDQQPILGGGGSGMPGFLSQLVPTLNIPSVPDEKNRSVYEDIAGVPWANEAIIKLSEMGVINGVGDNRFAPHNYVKREEFVKMAVLAFELAVENAEVNFTDVPSEHWGYHYIAAAFKAGIINGVSEHEFGTGLEITRQEIAAILHRYTQKRGIELNITRNDFADYDDISDFAKEAVEKLAGAGVINGFEDGMFLPKEPATRAQAAKMIYELLKEMKTND